MPAKDLEVIFLSEIVAAVRSSEDGMVSSARKAVAVPEADAVMKLIDEAIDSSLKQRTLRDLIATGS
jgi:DNA-binding IscR family transcriptional regulator